MPRGVRNDPVLPRRVAIVAGLCALTAIGLQARASLSGGGSASAATVSGQVLYDLIGAAEGAAIVSSLVLLIIVMRTRRARREADADGDDGPTPVWARFLSITLSLAAIGLPLWLIVYELRRRHAHSLASLLFGGGHGTGHRHVAAVPGSGWSVAGGMALAAAALIVAAVITIRRRAARERLTMLPIGVDQAQELENALSAGAAAIQAEDDPRTAIIACYAAMEQHLAGAGAAPAAADTPDEVLARAAFGGLIRSAAASELTQLFRQARYGGRDMAEADRTAAQDALARLRADLGSQSNGASLASGLDGHR